MKKGKVQKATKADVKWAQERVIKEYPIINVLHQFGFSPEVIRETVEDMSDEELIEAAKMEPKEMLKAVMKLR